MFQSFRSLFFLTAVVLALFSDSSAWAWGKRGHEIVASGAARILAEKVGKTYLRSHEFDLGYYANVPDIVFRNLSKEINEKEAPLHFIDWEENTIRVFKDPKYIPIDFHEFKAKMGKDFKAKNGLVPWRIADLTARCKKLATNMTKAQQGPLLVCLGVLSHYTGDSSQPLHVTDNYDGQKTKQKGVHHYYETLIVDALDPELKVAVLKRASEVYEEIRKEKMTLDQRLRWLLSESFRQIDEVLRIDKKSNRDKVRDNKEKYRPLIVENLAKGTAVTALFWQDILQDVNDFDEDKFYFFDGRPDYIEPTFEGKI